MSSFSLRQVEALSDAYYSSPDDDHFPFCFSEEECECEEIRLEQEAVRQASNLGIDY